MGRDKKPKKVTLSQLKRALTDTYMAALQGNCEFKKPSRTCCQLGYFDKPAPRPQPIESV